MPTIDTRPGKLDVLLFPGNAHSVELTWPSALTGRTFTANVDGTALTVTVVGAVVTVSFSAVVTAALTGRPTWKLIETTSGSQTRITGRVLSTTSPTESQTTAVTVLEDTVSVAVSVLGEPGPGTTDEAVQDLVGGMVTGNTETGVTVTYDDTNGKLDFVAEVTQAELDAEAAARAAADTAEATARAAADTAAIATAEAYAVQRANHTGSQLAATISDLTEAVQDIVGAAITAGARINVSYNDPAGTITIAVTGLVSTDLSDFTEAVQDVAGGMATDSGTIDFTYDDTAGTLTAVVKASSITTAMLAFDPATQAELDAAIAAEVTRANGTYEGKVANTAVLWGDSWASTNLKTSGTPDTYGGIKYFDAQGWMNWAQYWLRHRIEVLNNAGVAGETSAQILARFSAGVAAYSPRIVFIASPVINDVRASTSLATIQSNITAMLDAVQGIGATAVIFTCPPLSSSSLTSGQLAISHGYNHWLKNYVAASRKGVVVIDVHPALSDATAADDMLSKAIVKYTSDGTHLAAWGAARVGKLIYAALDPLVPRIDRLPHSTASNQASTRPNLLANAGLTGTGGTKSNGATGSVADSWTIQSSDGAAFGGTTVASLQDAVTLDPTDQVGGSWQQVVVTTAVSKVQFTQSVTTGFAGLDTVEAWVEFQHDADLASVSVLRLQLQAKLGGSVATVYGFDMGSDTANGLPLTENPMRGGVFRTPPLVIPSDATSLVWTMQVNGSGTWRFRRPALIKTN